MNDFECFSVRCGGHKYITLSFDNKFIFCLDNDMMYAEEMIFEIEKRTGMKFHNIHIIGSNFDFSGLRFFNGGWKRDFWNEFPNEKEINSFINLQKGKV